MVDNPHIDKDLCLSLTRTMLDSPKVINLGEYNICLVGTRVGSSTLLIPLASSDTEPYI
jgi:hypothetical protein